MKESISEHHPQLPFLITVGAMPELYLGQAHPSSTVSNRPAPCPALPSPSAPSKNSLLSSGVRALGKSTAGASSSVGGDPVLLMISTTVLKTVT